MRVLVTGPESSGTRLLARIAATGVKVEHRSMPHAGVWWRLEQMAAGFGDVIAVFRGPQETARSAVRAGHAADYEAGLRRRQQAVQRLTGVPWWTTYARLVGDPQTVMQDLQTRWGVALHIPEVLYDGDRKWGTEGGF